MEAAEERNEEQAEATLQHPWNQRVDENQRWYNRFLSYLEMGPEERSLAGLYNIGREKVGMSRAKSAPETWVKASRKFQWLDRARDYDAYQRGEQERDRVEQRRKEQEELARQRRYQREQELSDAEAVRRKAHEMLERPVEIERETESLDEEGIISKVIMPSDHVSFGTAAKMLKTASELARLALDMPTALQKLDFSKLTDDEIVELLERIAAEDREAQAKTADRAF
jgi:hypothetical protein